MVCVLRKNDWLAGEDGKRGLLLCATLYTTDTAGQEYMAPSSTTVLHEKGNTARHGCSRMVLTVEERMAD